MIKAYFETMMKYRYLMSNLIMRDLKVKYRRSVLGVLWSMLNPILMMLILNAVFSRVFRYEIENFPLYLISGQTLFSFFNEATSSAIFSIVEASSLLKKVYVPKYVFPIEKILFAFVNLLFSMSAIIVMLILFGIPFSFTMLLFPVPLLLMLVFTIGFGLIISALCVFFRDLKHLYSVVTMAWMYMTPIIYPIEALGNGFMRTVVELNPLTWYIQYFRAVIINGELPTVTMNLVCAGYALVFLVAGLVVFKKRRDRFILFI